MNAAFQIETQAPLRPLNTFGIEAVAPKLLRLTQAEQFATPELYQLLADHETFILGGGSNVLFVQSPSDLVLAVAHEYQTIEREDDLEVLLRVSGGTNWHRFVSDCVAGGWFGLENLALIPGTVGAAPIQNIGAYGVELREALEAVYARDMRTGAEVRLKNDECGFGYRTSRFKTDWKGKLLIESVSFRLSKVPKVNLSYAALAQALPEPNAATPQAVFEAVCRVRQSKLPDPALVGSAGSFFQNPVVDEAIYLSIQAKHPDVVSYPQADGRRKLAAGWLIERSGLRGVRRGDAGTWPSQALVLVNYGGATGAEIWALAQEIQAAVQANFGVSLTPEVQALL